MNFPEEKTKQKGAMLFVVIATTSISLQSCSSSHGLSSQGSISSLREVDSLTFFCGLWRFPSFGQTCRSASGEDAAFCTRGDLNVTLCGVKENDMEEVRERQVAVPRSFDGPQNLCATPVSTEFSSRVPKSHARLLSTHGDADNPREIVRNRATQ